MATTTYEFTRGLDYSSIVATSEKVAWTVDAIFRDRRFDAAKRIVPASWVRTQHLAFLNAQEQRTLNHWSMQRSSARWSKSWRPSRAWRAAVWRSQKRRLCVRR